MILETNRLTLRPWKEEDAESLYQYAKDPQVGPVAGWPVHTSAECSREIIRSVLSAPDTFAIVLKETNTPVGSIGLKRGADTDLTEREDECELGYWIGRPFWGRGLVPEAGREVLRYAFCDLGMKKVWCGYYDGNLKSKRVQEKLGFRYQWTTDDVCVPQLNEVRKGHVNCLTKEDWERERFTVLTVRDHLNSLRDDGYKALMGKVIPTVPREQILGIRTPALRQYARELSKDANVDKFLSDLPHRLFEENQLHGFILSGMKEYSECMAYLERFLPYVDNWATCDQLSPKVFRKHIDDLLPHILTWLDAKHEYTVRFGIKMLMEHYLEDKFSVRYLDRIASIRSNEYYVKMMMAWYFATALAKQYESTVAFIEENRLDPWTHNKTIQKAVESYRITNERKEYLKTLRRQK